MSRYSVKLYNVNIAGKLAVKVQGTTLPNICLQLDLDQVSDKFG